MAPKALYDCTLSSLEDADQDWMSWQQWFTLVARRRGARAFREWLLDTVPRGSVIWA
ncbi:hypothetical protein [Litchfieldella rifensis]|uniref:Uncharacterized protein n=1 Tax=Litchfieldella rifensis TaxID=762643 RepID=A0ABV7LPM1_9GAMM